MKAYIQNHYDEWLTKAEKVHIWFLRLVTVLLTIDLWLLPLSGIGTVWLFSSGGLTVSSGLMLGLFFISYGNLMVLLVWMCLLCKRLRIASYGSLCGLFNDHQHAPPRLYAGGISKASSGWRLLPELRQSDEMRVQQ